MRPFEAVVAIAEKDPRGRTQSGGGGHATLADIENAMVR